MKPQIPWVRVGIRWTLGVSPVRGYDVFPDDSFVIAVADDDSSYLEYFGVTEFHV